MSPRAVGRNGTAADYNGGHSSRMTKHFIRTKGTYQMQNLIVGKAITEFSAFV